MKTCLITAAAAAVLLATFSAPSLAQWPPYPTPNVPRTADGKPDLEGPVLFTEPDSLGTEVWTK